MTLGSGIFTLLVLTACSEPNGPPADPIVTSKESLLERAIRASGGRQALETVHSLTLTSELTELGRSLQVVVHLVLPDRYRHDVDTGDAHLIHATDGEEAWACLDSVPVPLELEEAQRLREQMLLVQLSLLVELQGDSDALLTEKGEREGLEWLEVVFRGENRGPYLLGFAPKSALLKRATWKTQFLGQGHNVLVTLELEDYRRVSGIMVPFRASYAVAGKTVAWSQVQAVRLNTVVAEDVFHRPANPSQTPILRRTTPSGHAAVMEPLQGHADDAERLLLAYLREHDISRNGPVFVLVDQGRPISAGIPVQPPEEPEREVPRPGVPRLTSEPARDVLTTIVTTPDLEAIEIAEQRLLREAELRGLVAEGPFRRVSWNREITQVQLTLRTENR